MSAPARLAPRTPRIPDGSTFAVGLLAVAALLGLAVAASGSPVLVVGGVLALVWLGFAFARPLPALAVAVLAIPLDTFAAGGAISPAQGLLLLTAVGAGARWWATRPLAVVPTTVGVGLAILVIASGTGVLFAPQPSYPLRQVVNWGACLLLFNALVSAPRTEDVRRVILAFAVCGGLVGLLAAVAPATGPVLYDPAIGERAAGSFGSPNGLGIFLALAIPCQLALLLKGPVLWRPPMAVALLCATFGLSLTLSRGAFLGLAVGLLVLMLWRPFRRAAGAGVLLLVVLSIVGANPLTSSVDADRIVSRISGTSSEAGTDPRGQVYRTVPRMVADRPLLGVGALEFRDYSVQYGIPITGGVTTHAHNIALTILVELGIFGLIGLVAFSVGLVAAIRRAVSARAELDRALAFGLGASFVALAVQGLVDYPLENFNIAVAVFVLAGCATHLGLVAHRRPRSEDLRVP
ncbi:O-antigen ligase [Patulibacter sp.]|uniref:O-antigen ligase family protein n=1 Tax=Patulibacter sp. TaxID=1912859 RepID=UPI00271DCE95|nr:O-antigen ligase family protein [Patulibacter sp.]MDO9407673.1 O-antigen ligase family protein [Patulibacter sp.]